MLAADRAADDAGEAAASHGARAWPDLRADRARFTRICEQCRARIAASGALPRWQDLNTSDLYLVAAIAGGDAAAIDAFTRTLLDPCRGPLARLGLTPALVDDVLA